MILFHNDYNEMCHESVMRRMLETQHQQMTGYGIDDFCRQATQTIRSLCGRQDISVHYLVGGTQTNTTVIAAALRPYQGVLTADSGHINVHETGAVEGTGHKILPLPAVCGKISADQIRQAVAEQRQSADSEHIVQPKLVYISNPTELGTIYSLAELTAISDVCRELGIYLFVDGARLGYGLTAPDNDITLPDLANLCDVFYIGGTKCGAMFGEAVVISNQEIGCDFRYMIKRQGGMLAKGWLLGLQFSALLENNLYFDICANANRLAQQIRETLLALGYPMLVQTTTNQIFPIMPDAVLEKLSKEFSYSLMDKVGEDRHAVRFCTSWGTTQENVTKLCNALREITP